MSELINEQMNARIRAQQYIGSQSDAAIKAPKKNLNLTISKYDDPVNYAATKRGIEKASPKRVRDFFAQLEG